MNLELAKNNICNDFTQRLFSLPNPDANYYLAIGYRCYGVESQINNDIEARIRFLNSLLLNEEIVV